MKHKELSKTYLLQEIIISISDKTLNEYKDECFIISTLSKFEKFYENDYRHKYSSIYSILNGLRKNDKGSLQIVNVNIEIICNYAYKNSSKYKKILRSLDKLYDHISLDIARFDQFNQIEEMTEGVKKQYIELNETNNSIEEKNKQSAEEIKSIKKEFVTLIGIFSSIVLAFFGKMVFTTSVLENVKNNNIFILISITSLIGYILVNMLYILISFISEISTGSKEIPFDLSKYNKSIKCTMLLGLVVHIIIEYKLFTVIKIVLSEK